MKASDLMLIRSHYNKYSIQYNADTIEPTHISYLFKFQKDILNPTFTSLILFNFKELKEIFLKHISSCFIYYDSNVWCNYTYLNKNEIDNFRLNFEESVFRETIKNNLKINFDDFCLVLFEKFLCGELTQAFADFHQPFIINNICYYLCSNDIFE